MFNLNINLIQIDLYNNIGFHLYDQVAVNFRLPNTVQIWSTTDFKLEKSRTCEFSVI